MPLRAVLDGNRELAASYLREASRVLWHLKAMLPPFGIQQGQLIRDYPDGTKIIVRKVFDLDVVNILSPFPGGAPRKERKQVSYVFIFYDESTWRLYSMEFDPAALTLRDETPATGDFPLSHVWYPDYYTIDKDPTPQVIPNLNNDSHYISTAIEPLFYPSKNAYDDWHYHAIQFYFDWIWDDFLSAPPVIQPVLGKTHVSISPYTAGSSFFFRMGGILPSYRLFFPEKALVPLLADGAVTETEVPNTGTSYFGPRGYTADLVYLNQDYASSWKEGLFPSGSNPPAIPQTEGEDDYLGYWFFPWMPYLHEFSNFHILDRGTYGSISYVHPTIATPRKFSLGYLDDLGSHTVVDVLVEEASYTDELCDTQIVNESELDPPDGFGYDTDFEAGSEYSYTYTVIQTNERGSASADGTCHSPIGSLGGKNFINIQNDFTIVITRDDRQHNVDFAKTSTLGYAYYILHLEPGFFMADGIYGDTTSGTTVTTEGEARTLEIRQRLFVGGEAIEDETSRLTYDYGYTLQVIEDVAWEEEWWHPPEFPPPFYFPRLKWQTFSSHSVTITTTHLGTTDRDITCFEVLAYDSRMNAKMGDERKDLVMLIYKKISLSQTQSSQNVQTTIYTAGGDIYPWPGGGTCVSDVTVDTFLASESRKVEFFLYYKIGSAAGVKVKLAEFNCNLAVEGGVLTQTPTGQRIWGASCQVNQTSMVYHFQLENFLSSGLGDAYDSPFNYEDISYEGNTRIWKPYKNVIGAVSVNGEGAPIGTHAQTLLDPISTPYVFSVGLHLDPEKETEQEE